MKRACFPLFAFALTLGLSAPTFAQKEKKDEEFLKEKPIVGEAFPELTVYRPDGKEFKTAELRGHYSVVVFGCLT